MRVVGVDPGNSGGICLLQDPGEVKVWRTPFVLHKDRYAKPVIDLEAAGEIYLHLSRDGGTDKLPVWIEASQIRMKTASRKTISGIWWYAGALDAMFRFWGCEVEYVQAKQWQAAILDPFLQQQRLDRPKSHEEWKEISVDFVRYDAEKPEGVLFPPTRTGRVTEVPHDGTADAYCIARFGQMVALGGIHYHRDWVFSPTKAKRIRRSKTKEAEEE